MLFYQLVERSWSINIFSFLICSILNFKTFGRCEGRVAQTTVEDEGALMKVIHILLLA
jgi:hypothetical protein